ncbi:MogA/MoaB family molybdenum cofactor biosynthesis protein [Halobacillus amylolyticus]|uniref:Molybdenum cofactor biosynthesis protein B n=1 Tax=Halobacillus amylolyticus TaxID=2932259 RepID=A0ABY4HBJ4_9BACI|nr:molybdenum cofactor biosynthesis protein B [Halobacillus amylolyticus]UOR11926.1 molybdenum cofactor biosynthesis protein MoaB [Halobacillus amylolyticus]
MAVDQHKKKAPKSVRCTIITVSDTRTKETDKSGKLMIEKLEAAQHVVLEHQIIKDERAAIETAVRQGIRDESVEVVLTNGGTGIAVRDVTIETVTSLFEKEIPGFGELFRMLSYTEDIGSAAILSRATAGVSGGTAIFSTPGSSGAVKLAMDKLILPEITHVMREVHKDL